VPFLILNVAQTIDKLDREIYYLRAVHTFCYYCAEQFEDDDDLRRRCGAIHLRAKNKKKDAPDTTPSEKGYFSLLNKMNIES
jgi:hypothetical protein